MPQISSFLAGYRTSPIPYNIKTVVFSGHFFVPIWTLFSIYSVHRLLKDKIFGHDILQNSVRK